MWSINLWTDPSLFDAAQSVHDISTTPRAIVPRSGDTRGYIRRLALPPAVCAKTPNPARTVYRHVAVCELQRRPLARTASIPCESLMYLLPIFELWLWPDCITHYGTVRKRASSGGEDSCTSKMVVGVANMRCFDGHDSLYFTRPSTCRACTISRQPHEPSSQEPGIRGVTYGDWRSHQQCARRPTIPRAPFTATWLFVRSRGGCRHLHPRPYIRDARFSTRFRGEAVG